MSQALIISNNFHYSQEIASFLEDKKWETKLTNLSEIMERGGELARGKTCLIFVLCRDILSYSQVIPEMSVIIKKCAAMAPVYFLFETASHQIFQPWEKYAKRVYENILSETSRTEALENIVRLEGGTLPREAFMSPMDWM